MENIQGDSSSEAPRPPDLKIPSMNVPDCVNRTQPFKVRRFIHSCQLILPNDQEKPSFIIGRGSKWIDPYPSSLTNQDPNYLFKNWELLESQLVALFGDPN
ncbi:hypothetical protein O181_004864 [Austropuccinia psidii MF-1]|uniref:Uncharacterized protein n=1 Tax=Austropuccinia psidii MF-1 TaxID=1389203 RepID=A0A9Q3BGK8_9BASI|nr:hypothetical protein [Austropuccinia psidii MF-1]